MLRYLKNESITPKEKIWIGEKSVAVDTTLEDGHTHEFIELVYVVDGYATQTINDNSFEVKKGDMFFVDYEQVHAYKAQMCNYTYIDILIDPQIIGEEFQNIETITEIFTISVFNEFEESNCASTTQCVTFKGEKRVRIEKIIEDMILEFKENKM